MKPLRNRIKNETRKAKVMQEIIEKDYALSYVLAGLASVPELADTLIFKGGTALKKFFFGDYRFSEDLDFSTIKAPGGDNLEKYLKQALDKTLRLLSSYGPFSADFKRYVEKESHPGGQEAFIVRLKYPWHPEPLCKIKLEITYDELLLLEPEKRSLIHNYDEKLKVHMKCYTIEEIILEKMRTLLQTQQKLVIRGWSRHRARDYYDLWRIIKDFSENIKVDDLSELLKKKCTHRKVFYEEINDFFASELILETEKHWNKTLMPFIRIVPPCNEVLSELKPLLNSLFL